MNYAQQLREELLAETNAKLHRQALENKYKPLLEQNANFEQLTSGMSASDLEIMKSIKDEVESECEKDKLFKQVFKNANQSNGYNPNVTSK